MSEVVLSEPLPLVWMGSYDDIKGDDAPRWQRGWAFFTDEGKYAAPRPIRPGLNRRPIVILCPMGEADAEWNCVPFCIDASATNGGTYWKATVDMDSLVVGQQPIITVSPSIHLVGLWHGWCENGILRG